jgi:hypothetical protein
MASFLLTRLTRGQRRGEVEIGEARAPAIMPANAGVRQTQNARAVGDAVDAARPARLYASARRGLRE